MVALILCILNEFQIQIFKQTELPEIGAKRSVCAGKYTQEVCAECALQWAPNKSVSISHCSTLDKLLKCTC